MQFSCRFRHLDTKVRLHARRESGSGNGGKSPSPERDGTRSPGLSPLMGRRGPQGLPAPPSRNKSPISKQ